jgi:ubiquitin-conjugating enzyme E2 variant
MFPFVPDILTALACVFVADFLSGLLHWLEDAYGRPEWPLIGRLVTQPNILHHYDPRHFTRHSWFQSSWLLILLASVGVLAGWGMGVLDWRVWLVAIIGANANQIHKWAHRTPTENGRLVTLLQHSGVLQSAAHHAQHHRRPKNTHYCAITNLLNPLLDGVRLWGGLEWLVFRTTGVRRRADNSCLPGNWRANGLAIKCPFCQSTSDTQPLGEVSR